MSDCANIIDYVVCVACVTCVLIGLNNMGFIHRHVTATGCFGHVCGADEQLVTQPAHLAVSVRASLFAASLIVRTVSTLVHISNEIQSRWWLLLSNIVMRIEAWLSPSRGEARKCRYRLVCLWKKEGLMASQLIPVQILWHKCHANAYSYVQGHTTAAFNVHTSGEGKTAKKPLNASHYL